MTFTLRSSSLLNRLVRIPGTQLSQPFSRSQTIVRLYSSTKDIQDQQHSGSRKAPQPTRETGTSTQASNDSAKDEPPEGSLLPDLHQQTAPEQEDGQPGAKQYMSDTEDTQGGELKSNSPFRAAPLEKSVG